MKKVFAVLMVMASMLFCVSNAAAQLKPEVFVGMTKFGKAIDGRWYQSPLPHELKLTSPSFGFGGVYTVSDTYKVRFGYEWDGKVSSSAEATASDENYANWLAGKESLWPVSNWYGKGSVQGLYVTAVRQSQSGFFLEGGLYLYKPTWEVTIPNWIGSRDATPQYLHVVHKSRLEVSPILGFGWKFGHWSVSYNIKRIAAGGDDYPAVFDKGESMFKLGYEW